MPNPALAFYSIPNLPTIEPGCDLAGTIIDALSRAQLAVLEGDVFVIAQKIVSRAEDCFVNLDDVEPSAAALALEYSKEKDPRIAELILRESKRIVRDTPTVLITEHRLGIILANAGIDRSNVRGDDNTALLLPRHPDRSAAELQNRLETHFGCRCGVIIADSLGRPWRLGTTGVAIGCAGVQVLDDQRGATDRYGRVLQVAEIARADAIAGAAGLVMGEGAEGLPVVIARGLPAPADEQTATTLLRPAHEDLFR